MINNDSALASAARRIDQVAIWSGRLTCWLLVPLVLGLTYEVVARYLFNAPTIWAYDLTFMLYGTFFMLGAAFALQRKGHVRTDMYYDRWSPRRQAMIDLVCYLLVFLPFVCCPDLDRLGLLLEGLRDQRDVRLQLVAADHLAVQAVDAARRRAC